MEEKQIIEIKTLITDYHNTDFALPINYFVKRLKDIDFNKELEIWDNLLNKKEIISKLKKWDIEKIIEKLHSFDTSWIKDNEYVYINDKENLFILNDKQWDIVDKIEEEVNYMIAE